jgi:DNA repair exonuclease SbcCD ATPase subunit
MEEQLSLDDVGQAESVINRLIQERKSLENATKVLQTYRMVKTELQPALGRLNEVQVKIDEAQQRLSNVQAQEKVALDKMEKNVVAYEKKRGEQVEKNIAALQERYDKLEKAFDALVKENDKMVEGYNRAIEKATAELNDINVRLNKAKGEHAVLAEAVGRASQMFQVNKE